MAAGSLSKPGTKYGPCENETCWHRDCIATRKRARSICTICNKPIGYDTLFYEDQDGLQHAFCLEEQIKREQNEKTSNNR